MNLLKRPSSLLLIISAILFGLSLAFNGFCLGQDNCWPGWGILIMGAMGVMGLKGNLAWLANPLLGACWGNVFYINRKNAVLLSCCALAFSIMPFLGFSVTTSESGTNYEHISEYGLGYWLWLGSIVMACVAAFLTKSRIG